MSNSALLASTLRRLAAVVERMSDEELVRLNEPGTEIEIKMLRRRAKEELPPEERLDLVDIVANLTACPNRAEASKFLERGFETKKILEQLARHLDVAVLKQDKTETLRDKIIEATVGARLRSEAIQGGD
jgi:DNA polymerase III gamma/tau subunit